MNKEYCRHCVCLFEGSLEDEWRCDSHNGDDITTFEECPEIDDQVVRCPECGEEFNTGEWGHEVDSIKEFSKCAECLGYCPICKRELEKAPAIVEKITHGYMVQEIDLHKQKVVKTHFHPSEAFWEKDGIDVESVIPDCIRQKYYPMPVMQEFCEGIIDE